MSHATIQSPRLRALSLQRLACTFALAALAGCGGGGGASGAGSIVPSAPGGNAPSDQAVSTVGTISNADGTISGMITGGFTLDTGGAHGKIHVLVSNSTVITGGALAVGANVSVNGTGTWTTSINATSIAVTSASIATPTPAAASTATPQTISVPTGAVSTQGNNIGVRTGGFTLDQGYPNGKIPITVNASTVQINGTPSSGGYVQVTGTGSVHSSITASIVTYWSSAPGSTSATGTIVAATAYGFTLNVDSNHQAVPIILNPQVIIAGGTLQTGSIAQVSGTGSIAESITPTQIVVTNPTPQPAPNTTPTPTPGPISQTHVMTADYLGGYYGTRSIAWSTAARYLNWASTNPTDANAISAAGIKTMYYTNPNRVESTDPMYSTDETIFAHDCSGHRISTNFNGVTEYVTDVNSTSLHNDYRTTMLNQIGSAHFDAFFEDNTGTLTSAGIATLPCSYSDSSWISGEASVAASAPVPVILNGLSGLNGHDVSATIGIVNAPNTLGGTFEHCYADSTSPAQQGDWLWQAVENTELQVAAKNALFLCMQADQNSASSEIAARTYAEASFLLSYNPATSTMWTEYGTPSGLHVMPESQLIALNPKTAAPASISGLQTSSGAYGREYNTCYIAGSFVGPCAVAVNSSSQLSETFPYPQYHHTLVMSGSSIVDGGTIAANGAAAPSTMAPLSAYIVFP